MKEDELLARIGKTVRDEQKDDARFERIARGEASAEELLALEKAAREDPEIGARLEASRPFDEVAVARIAARAKSAPPKSSAKKPATLVRRIGIIAGPLALAAAIFLYFSSGQRGP